MTSPAKPWETPSLLNSSQVTRNANYLGPQMSDTRSAPVLPPLPRSAPPISNNYNSYLPYGSSGYNSIGYGGYGGSYGMPYRGYSGYGSYGSYGMTGMGGYPGFPPAADDAERRFVQYAEESSRNTFANVESIVRAFNSIAMMLDNTFFAMTSSFRAVLSVAENFGKLRTMFGHIWYSINIFRLFNWLYRKLMWLGGRKIPKSDTSLAWKEAAKGTLPPPGGAPAGSNWPTLAFLGMLVSAPYIISKFLPKYEDKSDPTNWKSPGVKAKAAFDFVARGPTELTIQMNDEVTLAPTYIQEEMNLKSTGWAFALCNGKSGIVPLNYLLINKSSRDAALNAQNNQIPVPKMPQNNNNNNTTTKTHTKKVSFGENQIFENVDLEDYVTGKKAFQGMGSAVRFNPVWDSHSATKTNSLANHTNNTKSNNVNNEKTNTPANTAISQKITDIVANTVNKQDVVSPVETVEANSVLDSQEKSPSVNIVNEQTSSPAEINTIIAEEVNNVVELNDSPVLDSQPISNSAQPEISTFEAPVPDVPDITAENTANAIENVENKPENTPEIGALDPVTDDTAPN